MTITYFLLLSLAVCRVTEWLQELMPWGQRSWFVSFFSLVFSAASLLVLPTQVITDWRKDVVWCLGVWGASALTHGVESLLRATKDLANSNWLAQQKKGANQRRW